MEPMKTIGEVAALFQISRSKAFELKKKDQWPHHRVGVELRFSAEDIEAIRLKYAQAPPEPRRTPRAGTRANRRNKQ